MNHKIILGTAQFGLPYGIANNKRISVDEIYKILDYAYYNEIKTLDTAESYGNAHEIIGNYHKEFKSKFKINTKIKQLGTKSDFDRKLDDLLEVLNVEKINTLMLHSTFEDAKLFEEYKSVGLDRVKSFGTSIYLGEDLNFINIDDVDCVQLPFNLLDNYYKRKNTLEVLKKHNLRVDVRSIFLQGLLSNYESIKNDQLKPLVKNIEELKSKLNNEYSIKYYAICYPLMQDNIDKVIFGVDSLNQLKENIDMISVYNKIFKYKDIIDNHQCSNDNLLDPRNWL
jgi:aryl-alcohol dehydrogenase-like predicted oxidoreductase